MPALWAWIIASTMICGGTCRSRMPIRAPMLTGTWAKTAASQCRNGMKKKMTYNPNNIRMMARMIGTHCIFFLLLFDAFDH